MASVSDLGVVRKIRRLARSGEARKLRERSGVSLREMASEIGVHPSSLSRWETGTTAPRAQAASRWATELFSIALEIGSSTNDRAQSRDGETK